MLSQQMGSLLRNAVDIESVNGEKAFFDQVGSAAAVLDNPSCGYPADRYTAQQTHGHNE